MKRFLVFNFLSIWSASHLTVVFTALYWQIQNENKQIEKKKKKGMEKSF